MGEKDITEKMLLDYNDVFADVMNVLLFEGKRVINEEDLATSKDKSQYKADGRIHENERDVVKMVKKNNEIIALLGIENMTKGERLMALRLAGYDGISYGAQYMRSRKDKKHGKGNRQKKPIDGFPVITVVLYYGLRHWSIHRHLKDVIDVPEAFAPFVNDYKINCYYELAFLDFRQARMFKSDFRFVVDYLMKMRLYGIYEPLAGSIIHVDALVKLMTVITGDPEFERMLPEIRKTKGKVTMESIWTQAQNQGIKIGEKRGKKNGIEIGEKRGKKNGIEIGKVYVYYHEMHLSPKEIADRLGKSINTVENYLAELTKEKRED